MSTYWEKLQDPRWQRRRLEIFGRAGFKCEACGNDKLQLHCHHKIYHKGREPWEYTDRELACLCDMCHEKWHEAKDDIDAIVSELSLPRMREMLAYGIGLAMKDGSAAKCRLFSDHVFEGFANCFGLEANEIPKLADEEGWVHISSVRELIEKGRGSK